MSAVSWFDVDISEADWVQRVMMSLWSTDFIDVARINIDVFTVLTTSLESVHLQLLVLLFTQPLCLFVFTAVLGPDLPN